MKKGLKFIRYKNVIQLSKAPCDSLRKTDGFAYIGDVNGLDKQLAVLVMTGVCVGSHLLQPVGSVGFRCKKLFLKLFTQEYELFQSRIAHYFQTYSFHGPMDSGTIAFQTKKENSVSRNPREFIILLFFFSVNLYLFTGSSTLSSPTKGNPSLFVASTSKKLMFVQNTTNIIVKGLDLPSFYDWQANSMCFFIIYLFV